MRRGRSVPLTELGRRAAWRVGRRFAEADQTFGGVYASPVLRTVETAAARVTRTVRELAARTTGDLLLVGHGLAVGGVAAGLVGSDEGVSTPLCGVTRVGRVDGGWRLAFSGDTSHL